jgi:hypothetical protein
MRPQFLGPSIIIALLIELAMVDQGLAQCHLGQCSRDAPVKAQCETKEYWLGITSHRNSLGALVRHHNEDHPRVTERFIWNLHSNKNFRNRRSNWDVPLGSNPNRRSCACLQDQVCFPSKYNSTTSGQKKCPYKGKDYPGGYYEPKLGLYCNGQTGGWQEGHP